MHLIGHYYRNRSLILNVPRHLHTCAESYEMFHVCIKCSINTLAVISTEFHKKKVQSGFFLNSSNKVGKKLYFGLLSCYLINANTKMLVKIRFQLSYWVRYRQGYNM